jgi:hypothetical protein
MEPTEAFARTLLRLGGINVSLSLLDEFGDGAYVIGELGGVSVADYDLDFVHHHGSLQAKENGPTTYRRASINIIPRTVTETARSRRVIFDNQG